MAKLVSNQDLVFSTWLTVAKALDTLSTEDVDRVLKFIGRFFDYDVTPTGEDDGYDS